MRVGVYVSQIAFLAVFALALTTGCLGSDSESGSPAGGGANQSPVPSRGIPLDKSLLRFKLKNEAKLRDDVSQLIIDILEVQFINAAGQKFTVSKSALEVDLFKLVRHETLEIGFTLLPMGTYNQIRMILGPNSRVLTKQGAQLPVKIPSGMQSGLKFDGAFELRGGRITNILVDFDSEKSIHWNRGQDYMLKPTIPITSVSSLTTQQEAALQKVAGVSGGDLMLESADLVVQSVAQQKTSREGVLNGPMGARPMIFTYQTLGVSDVVKGSTGSTIELELLGGIVGDRAVYVSHVTHFLEGESSLVFLKNYPGGLGTLRTNDGKITLE